MSMITEFIKDTNVPINLIEYLSYFLSVRYNNFGSDLEKTAIEQLLNTFINKVVYMKISFAELQALVTNSFVNCYGYLKASDEKYSDVEEIKKLMVSLDLYSLEDKIDLLKTMVMYMYLISDENCQKKIKEYIDREDYFSIDALNKKLNQYQLEKLIICTLMYHAEGVKDFSEKDKAFIVSYIKENSKENKLDYILSYYKGLQNVDEAQKTDKIKEVITLFEENYKTEKENDILRKDEK
ncbi:MAG: hypothetical protein J6I73_07650 [Treponema sp.]|nr:hypothetical protein [Treponema sp.]